MARVSPEPSEKMVWKQERLLPNQDYTQVPQPTGSFSPASNTSPSRSSQSNPSDGINGSSLGSYGIFCLCFPSDAATDPSNISYLNSNKSPDPPVVKVWDNCQRTVPGDALLPLNTQTTLQDIAIHEDANSSKLLETKMSLVPLPEITVSKVVAVTEVTVAKEEQLPEPLLEPHDLDFTLSKSIVNLKASSSLLVSEEEEEEILDAQHAAEPEVPTISKLRQNDVEKILQIHKRRLIEYVEYEKLFMAAKHLEFLHEVIQYNRQYWNGFLSHLQLLQKVSKEESLTKDTYLGSVGEEECHGILAAIDEFEKDLYVACGDIQSCCRNGDEISKFEILSIKVKMALENLSFFHLDHLKAGCTGRLNASGGSFSHLHSSIIVSPSNTPVAESIKTTTTTTPGTPMPSDVTGQGTPSSSRHIGSSSGFPEDLKADFVHSPESLIAPWAQTPPPVSMDSAEAAMGAGSSSCLLTSNMVLLMLLKGEHVFGIPNSSQGANSSSDAVAEHILLPVEEETSSFTGDAPEPIKARPSGRSTSPLKALSKKMSITRKYSSRHKSMTTGFSEVSVPPPSRTVPADKAYNPNGSSIGRMGSRVLYSLTHPHHYTHGPRPHQQKRAILEDADSWTTEKSKFLDLWYRVEKDTSVSIKVRGKLPCRLFEVLAILNETDLAVNWAPMFKYAVREQQMSRASQMVRQVSEYPLLGQKESIMYCYGVDALAECGCVMVFCKAPPDGENFFLGYPLPSKGKIARVQSATLCFLLFPVSQGQQTTLELYANFAHGVRFVPNRVITYIVKKVVKGVFVSIAKQCQNFAESEYAARVKDDPEFYDWMRNTIDEFCNVEDGTLGHRFHDTISLESFDINEFHD